MRSYEPRTLAACSLAVLLAVILPSRVGVAQDAAFHVPQARIGMPGSLLNSRIFTDNGIGTYYVEARKVANKESSSLGFRARDDRNFVRLNVS
jgi:hypothetical protein